tara:strand:- start:475 stop:1632 length:1158 start_codon:yes stop_codon:yes gene_type:complete
MEFDDAYNTDVSIILDMLERNGINNKLSTKITKTLYDDINEAFQYVDSKICNVKFSKLKYNQFRIIQPRRYFSKQSQSKAFSKDMTQLLTKIKINDRDIEICFGISDEKKYNKKNLIENVRIMSAVLYICGKYALKQCSKTLNILLLMLDDVKLLPSKSTIIIGSNNVNSGYSYVCERDNEIVVYRSEEWFKVFIHETFHAYGLDGTLNIKGASDDVKKLFNVNSTMSLGEAYVETWARIMNTSISSFIKTENYISFSKLLGFSIEIDSYFAVLQSTKIFGLMGLDYDDVCNTDSSLSRHIYKENSNVFSYYVLSSILMSNIDEFLSWCLQNNEHLLRFGETNKEIKSFSTLISKIYKSDNMLSMIEDMKHIPYHNGLRMSIIDV